MNRTPSVEPEWYAAAETAELRLNMAIDAVQDTGCRFAPSCLSCPFPRCVYEENQNPRMAAQRLRNQEIARRLRAGEPAVALSAVFGISKRNVYRAARLVRG